MSRPNGADGPWVLVADGSHGQSRSALAAVRALGLAGYRAVVTQSGPQSVAAASRFCSGVVHTPPASDPAFVADVRRELCARDYLTVVPASDAVMVALSSSGKDFVDKGVLSELARAADIRTPEGVLYGCFNELEAGPLPFPCVVKASLKTGFGVLSARLLRGPDEVGELRGATGSFIVQPFVPEPMHSICGVMWRRKMVVALHQRHLRLWPPTCGDTCAAVTAEPDPLACARLEQLLAGYEGIFQAEFAGDLLLDINPRAYASLPLATSAGVNLLAYYCDLLQGKPPAPAQLATGVGYRWWEGELRHAALRARAGRRPDGPLRLPRRRRWSSAEFDPKPTLARLRHIGEEALVRGGA